MSSGSLKQFLKKTKKNHKTMNEKVKKKRLYNTAYVLEYEKSSLKVKKITVFKARMWDCLSGAKRTFHIIVKF